MSSYARTERKERRLGHSFAALYPIEARFVRIERRDTSRGRQITFVGEVVCVARERVDRDHGGTQ